MENLSEGAQIAAIIVGGMVLIAWFITLNDSWKDIFKK